MRAGFEAHLEQTKEHVARLEEIFKALGENPTVKKCHGMEGLVKEGGELIAEGPAPEELDAGLISAAQHVEHHEIAGYGCVSAYARLLGENQAVSLLRKTLEEERDRQKTTQLSGQINLEAAETDETHVGNGHPKKSATAKATTAGA